MNHQLDVILLLGPPRNEGRAFLLSNLIIIVTRGKLFIGGYVTKFAFTKSKNEFLVIVGLFDLRVEAFDQAG